MQFVDRNGYEPSYQQIARQLGVRSKGGVQRHIAALENQGFISRRRENGSFGIEFHARRVESGTFGNIEFIETDVDHRETARSMISVPKFLIGSLLLHEVFAIRAVDDSMLDRHICEGDIVIFEKRDYASRGQISVISAGEHTRFGQFRNMGTEVEIGPANTAYETVTLPADEVKILGVMRGLVRPVPTHDS